MTEAELAIEEKLRRKREEQEQIWNEYLEVREKERQKEEDDLRKLKERQVSKRVARRDPMSRARNLALTPAPAHL